MAGSYAEYTTLTDLRGSTIIAEKQIDLATTTSDSYLLALIRSVSRRMESGSRWYYPRITTAYYDRAGGRQLDIDNFDWLEITTVTNGDGTTISSTNYDLLPYEGPPYYALRLKLTSGLVWLVDANGNSERAETILGVAGYARDYSNQWQVQASTATLAAGSTTALAGLTSGELKAGQLLRLGSTNDYAYVSAASGTTATLIRSVNGATGIAHAADAIYVWNAGDDLSDLCRQAVQAFYKMRTNPVGETVAVPGMGTFNTPKDVEKWLDNQLYVLGYEQPY